MLAMGMEKVYHPITRDYLEAGPTGVDLSPQRRSAPLQLSTRLSLARLLTEPIS